MWARVQDGDWQAWRARRIADHTVSLSLEAADYVDRHVAPVAHKIGPAQTQRLVDEAIARIDPDQVVETADTSADRRHVTIHDHQVSFNGTMRVEADLDIADALDLDAALSARAQTLKDLGCDESLDVRRSLALGDLARTQLGLELTTGEVTPQTRDVVLHVHLTDTAIAGRGTNPELARLERGNRLLLADQVRHWCGRPETKVTVKPVINLHERLATGAYEHHRLKTLAGWTYTVIEPGTYLWRSPAGLAYQRDHTGTTPLE